MAAKSFIEVLEEQIRNDLRKEIEAEVRKELGVKSEADSGSVSEGASPASLAGRIETWLASNVEKSFFDRRNQARRAYKATPAASPEAARGASPRTKTSTGPKDEPARVSCRTIEQLTAFELLKRNSGSRLPDAFTEAELKAVWRRAALKTHPDRFAQSDAITQARANALFAELAEAYESLLNLFEVDGKQAA